MAKIVHVGVDVGGTNTDAVVLSEGTILGWSKQATTDDVTTGVCAVVSSALDNARNTTENACQYSTGIKVNRVHIGTTHFVNAVLQKNHLIPVAVIRLCGPASLALPPFSDFPQDLENVVGGPVFMVDGGYLFDGQTEIRPLNKEQVVDCIQQIRDHGISHIVVSGLFSPVNNTQEIQVGHWIKEFYPEASFTLSHEVAQLGVLLRENSAVLNESLKPLSVKTMGALRNALNKLNLKCAFFLTQNDGTLLNSEQAQKLPVLTFASGPTNSMRGAAYLSGVKDAVVMDIGGTSTDGGILKAGFPRQATSKVKVGGVLTSFQMPDTLSIALGGGSCVRFSEADPPKIKIGPDSVGNRLKQDGIVFGGDVLTTTDIAVAEGLANLGSCGNRCHWLPDIVAKESLNKIHEMVEDLVDRLKISEEALPVILVGGGSILIDVNKTIQGTTEIIRPEHYQVANAVGAALSQVSGQIDAIVHLNSISREEALKAAKVQAVELATKRGANPDTIEILDVNEVPLTYLPGNVTRLQVKAVGDIIYKDCADGVTWYGDRPVSCITDATSVFTDHSVTPVERTASVEKTHEFSVEGFKKEATAKVDQNAGEWHLNEYDIECISVGAGILGCGGGGSPHIGKLMAIRQLRAGKKIRVISAKRFKAISSDKNRALAISSMGAPTVLTEMLYNSVGLSASIEGMKTLYSLPGFNENAAHTYEDIGIVKEEGGVHFIPDFKANADMEPGSDAICISAIFVDEIGGANSIVPLVVASELKLPIVDCDTMGRAFPELQMCTTLIHDIPAYPAVLSDHNGRKCVCLHAESSKQLEDQFRKICIEMGCRGYLCMRPLHGKELLEKTVLYSLSRAWRLGRAVLHSRKTKTSPIQAILEFENGKLICTAKICDIERRTEGGFARGEMKLEGLGDFAQHVHCISFQNENLIAKEVIGEGQTKIHATVPDLITVVDLETGEPLPTDEIRYGLRIAVLALPAPPLLRTPESLAVVGPKAFGYSDMEYEPIGEYSEHGSVPL